MRIRVILNPCADNGRGIEYVELIADAAQPFGGVDIVQTEYPGHAIVLAQTAVSAGYDVVAAAGGDGTISDVVNGLVDGQKAHTKLGIIPIGSANDLAWDLGMAMDIETAVSRLFSDQTKTIDLARVEDDLGRQRIIDNNMGIGFDAVVVIETERITCVHGFLKYLLATLRTIAFYYKTLHLKLTFDNENLEQDALFVAFGLGRRQGGGFLITPDADHNDNLIDTCTVNPINRITMLYMLLSVMRVAHTTSKHVTMRQSGHIIIKSDGPLPIHTDGEVFATVKDNVRQVTITSLPAAIEVVV